MEDKRCVVVKYKKNKKVRYNHQEYIIDVNNKAYICERINDRINYICCGLWNEEMKSIIWNKDSKLTITKEEASPLLVQELIKRKNILLGQYDVINRCFNEESISAELDLVNSLLNKYYNQESLEKMSIIK